jgi:cephalosporin hydroxylase
MNDHEQFAAEQRQNATALAGDEAVQRQSRELFASSDCHGYSYVWRWLGLPIIQLPTDMVALQEIIWANRPQLIIETGVARGGSLVFFASLLQLIDEGVVVGIDIDIRAHNREAIKEHPLSHRIRLVEGSSTADETVAGIREAVRGVERVMVILDSDHTHDHVLNELRLYAPLVTPGQYLVVADTIVEHIPKQSHRPRSWGPGNNPATALDAFLADNDRFERDPYVNGKLLLTSSPGGYLRRLPDR